MPMDKFFGGSPMTLPASMFTQTISGEYPEGEEAFTEGLTDSDLIFQPDYSTLAVVPWASDPTAQVIHDAYHKNGSPFDIAPRNVLKRVVQLYAARGLRPVVAPEMEFYLVKPNIDPDYPLEPPVGRSGRPERARQAYSISAVNEFEELFDDIYRFSEAQGLEIDTLNHEDGTAQMEINLRHGDPLELADQVFLFKRTIREAALRHDMYATFMAKPIAHEPGSAMHIHHSVVHTETGENIFKDTADGMAPEFLSYIAGMQTYLPRVMCMLAPYVNSYPAPGTQFQRADQRALGLRQPHRRPAGAAVGPRQPPRREPRALLRRQPLSRHGGVAGLRLSRARRRAGARPSLRRRRQRPHLRAAPLDPRRGAAPGEHPGARRDLRREFRAHLSRHQGDRTRDVHGRDQPPGNANTFS